MSHKLEFRLLPQRAMGIVLTSFLGEWRTQLPDVEHQSRRTTYHNVLLQRRENPFLEHTLQKLPPYSRRSRVEYLNLARHLLELQNRSNIDKFVSNSLPLP